MPKLEGGIVDVQEKNEQGEVEISYHAGTPSLTDLKYLPGDQKKGSDMSGSIEDPSQPKNQTLRTAIRVHSEGLSTGCLTIGGFCVYQKRKEAWTSIYQNVGLIEKLMKKHASCGGFYIEIVNANRRAEVPEDLMKLINKFRI